MTPEEIAKLTAEELAQKIAEVETQLSELLDRDSHTAEEVQVAEELQGQLDGLQAEEATRQEAGDSVEKMRTQRDERQQAREAREAEETQTAANAEAEEVNTEGPNAEGAQEQEQEQEAVAASGSVRAAARRRPASAPAEEAPEGGELSIVAAADVPGVSTGSTVDGLSGLVAAARSRSNGFPSWAITGRQRNGELRRFGVASVKKPFPEDLISTSRTEADELLDHAASEHRLQGESLVAAGGWCAPSETLYDLCDNGASLDGLFDLPEVQVTRGGLNYTSGPDFSSLYDAGFQQTEAQAIAGQTKTCFEIPCPEFQEVRLDALGICIKIPLLTQAGWPELTSAYMSEALVAHQHNVSAYLLQKAVAAAGVAEDYTTTMDAGSTATSALAVIEFLIEKKRQAYRLGNNVTMEVAVPHWVQSAVRADLSARTGVEWSNVTDEMITAAFAARRARVQWLYNWQDLDPTALAYPETFQALVWVAGTFIRGSADVINIEAVYDTASLQENTYTGLFLEEGVLLATRCREPSLATVPVCNAGITGAANSTACLTAVAAV